MKAQKRLWLSHFVTSKLQLSVTRLILMLSQRERESERETETTFVLQAIFNES